MKPFSQTITITHDSIGRVATPVDQLGTIFFVYHNNGNPTSVSEGSVVLTRTFDNMNRVESYTDANGNTVEYEWDKNGRLIKLIYPDEREVAYTYDRHNRLKTVTDWASRVTTYHWDAVGRLIGLDRPNGTTRTNEYTLGDELERYYERNGAGILQAYARFGYDLDSRIDWRYRLPKPQEVTIPAFSATYDNDNRVATWNSESVTHDVDGNMTFGPLPGEEDFISYSFDARNRLTAVGDVTYTYDSENNRIAKTTPDGTTTYVFDPHGDALPRVLVRERPDESLTFYVYGIGLLYEVDDEDDATYYHFDQSGSTVALTDDSGEVTDRIEYTPYGTISHRTGETDTPFLYAGQFGIQTDPNGLLHMRARYYSPELKRFINADPAGFDGGLNWYAYANNSPLMYVDPDGEVPILATVAIGMAIGAALDVGMQMAAEGRSFSEINWGRTAVSAGIGAFGGGAGSAIRTAGLATKIKRFFYDPRPFRQISREYWSGSVANGRSLHHWMIPQRATAIPQGIRNAGWNLMELPAARGVFHRSLGMNQWMGFAQRWGGSQALKAKAVENSIRVGVPASIGGSAFIGGHIGNNLWNSGSSFPGSSGLNSTSNFSSSWGWK